jgi:3-hydroxyacyl-CoA dehydrogenase
MKPGAIIASNTSGLPIAQMAEGRSKAFKENFLILHFFNPVRYMKILECIAGPDTSKEVCDFVSKWGEQTLGKGVVWGKDTPNFIGNRIGMISICEALILLEKGLITIPEADAIFSKPMVYREQVYSVLLTLSERIRLIILLITPMSFLLMMNSGRSIKLLSSSRI